MKYLLFDADTKEYLDAFDEICDWGYVIKQFQTEDFTLVYRKEHNKDWTQTKHNPEVGADLDCIKCNGKLNQLGGSNFDKYTKTHYKCIQCGIEMEMIWNKHAMKNRVTPYVRRLHICDDDECPVENGTCEEITT